MKTDYLKDINNPDNQLALIELIRKGEIKFKHKGPYRKLFKAYKQSDWTSTDGHIKFWTEYGSFGNFSYLSFDGGKDVIDTLKYGTEIALTIQAPEKDWLATKR